MKKKTKLCSCCGKVFPIEEFGKNMQTPDGLSYYSKPCAIRKQREFREANPDLVKAARERYLNKLRARNRARIEQSEMQLND
jgi:hypothetical protein